MWGRFAGGRQYVVPLRKTRREALTPAGVHAGQTEKPHPGMHSEAPVQSGVRRRPPLLLPDRVWPISQRS